MIDNAERKLCDELGCIAVIHMDPVETDNEVTNEIKEKIAQAMAEFDEKITIHDFRVVPGTSHTNVIFDAVVPHEIKKTDMEISNEISDFISEKFTHYNAVVNIDRPFV